MISSLSTNKMQSDQYAQMYSVEDGHWWYKALREVLLRDIKRINPERILDVGCGTGRNLQMFMESGFNAEGLDASEIAVEFCKKRGAKATQCLIQEMPFAKNSFECVCLIDMIGNLNDSDLESSLAKIFEILKTNGRLIIHVSALQFLYSEHDIASGTLHRFTKKELVTLLKKSGFKIERVTYRLMLLFPILAFVKIVEKVKIAFGGKIKGDLEKSLPIVDSIFGLAMKLENWLMRFMNFPVGTSLYVIATKP